MGRGGARPGAGRKSNAVKAFVRVSAAEVLGDIDEKERWKHYLHHHDPKIAFEALKYLTDRRDGKPSQALMLSGNPDEPAPIAVTVDL